MGSKFLSYGDLWNLGITFSPVHLWRLERDGKFPRHIPITAGGRKAWLESEVVAWQQERIAARDHRLEVA
jgi:predicted DNA-binding transcriptional regulator AlpA